MVFQSCLCAQETRALASHVAGAPGCGWPGCEGADDSNPCRDSLAQRLSLSGRWSHVFSRCKCTVIGCSGAWCTRRTGAVDGFMHGWFVQTTPGSSSSSPRREGHGNGLTLHDVDEHADSDAGSLQLLPPSRYHLMVSSETTAGPMSHADRHLPVVHLCQWAPHPVPRPAWWRSGSVIGSGVRCSGPWRAEPLWCMPHPVQRKRLS